MKHTIYSKLLISYLIYGVIAFFIICTFTQHLTTDYIEKQEASNLYREASIIADDYASEYFGSSMSLSDFQNHINKNIHSDKSHGYKWKFLFLWHAFPS